MGSGEHEIPQGPDTIGPSLGDENLNPGIVQLVKLLNDAGFGTTDSGDGETHDHDCDRDHGYVVIMTDSANLVTETDRLKTVLEQAGILVVPQDMGRPEVGCCYVQAMYCPADGFAIIDVMHVHDRMIRPTR